MLPSMSQPPTKRKLEVLQAPEPKKRKIAIVEARSTADIINAVLENNWFCLHHSLSRLPLKDVLNDLKTPQSRKLSIEKLMATNQLKRLDLHDCPLEPAESSQIFSGVTDSLTELDFRGTMPSKVPFSKFRPHTFTYVDISNNTINEEIANQFAQFIASNTRLNVLKISNMRHSLTSVFKAMKHTPQLRELDVSDNPLEADEYKQLIDSLKKCYHLTDLNLSGCKATISTEDFIFPLEALTEVKYLNLSRNSLSDLSKWEPCHCYSELDLSFNNLTNKDLCALLRKTQVRKLNMIHNPLTDADFKQLENVIKRDTLLNCLMLEADLHFLAQHRIRGYLELNNRRFAFEQGCRDIALPTAMKIDLLDDILDEAKEAKDSAKSTIEQIQKEIAEEKESFKSYEKDVMKPVQEWNNETVVRFIREQNINECLDYFIKGQIDGETLQGMTSNNFSGNGDSIRPTDFNKIQQALFVMQNRLKKEPSVFSWTDADIMNWLKSDGLHELHALMTAGKLSIAGKELLFLDYFEMVNNYGLSPKQAAMLQRAVDRLKETIVHGQQKPPDHLICPITYELMKDPVIASDGQAYERTAIEDWLKKNDRSPMTNEVLLDKKVYPCQFLKNSIADYLAKNNQ